MAEEKKKIDEVCGSVEEFLKECEHSGDAAYAALRSVLELLEDPNSRVRARIFLSDLQNRFPNKQHRDHCFRNYHFLIQDIVLDQHEGIVIIIYYYYYYYSPKLSFLILFLLFLLFCFEFYCEIDYVIFFLQKVTSVIIIFDSLFDYLFFSNINRS